VCEIDEQVLGHMSIEGLIGGVLYLVVSVASSGTVDSRTIWNAAVLADKAVIKTEQGTWGASAHEESHQAIKDNILKLGQR
jgi:hypothetical protein